MTRKAAPRDFHRPRASASSPLPYSLVLFALRDTIVFFHTPKEVAEKQIPAGKRIRLGGLVADGSLKRGEGLTVTFAITDTAKTIPVSYTGILPDLFREGQGVVAEGKLDPAGRFHADTVLAKHDENYMPPEVAKALKATRRLERRQGQKRGAEMTSLTCVMVRMANPIVSSPLWGRDREGGIAERWPSELPPPLTPPHKGEGNSWSTAP